MQNNRIVVIGAGLGGISAAISLRQEGYDVDLYEKNGQIGGKLNQLKTQGYTFDLGPSILTLPKNFAPLFERSGRRMEDYIPMRTVRPHWRNFFEDGTVVNLFPEPERMRKEADALAAGAGDEVERFLSYAAAQYDLIDRGYFREGLDTLGDFVRFYGLHRFPQFDLLHSMHTSVCRRIHEPHLRDVFDFFIKYVGSSALDAPGVMNCLPAAQFRHDLWYVDGGLYGIADGLGRLMDEIGVSVHLNREVASIDVSGTRATGIRLADGAAVPADFVVSNMEVVPACRELLRTRPAALRRLERKYEPSCSGLVVELGLDRRYEQLAHHNFFFSGNQRNHFKSVFRRKQLPDDPTIYLVAAARTDPSVAPAGCDVLKILPHIPYLNERNPYGPADYQAFKEKVYDKLERMGLVGLREHIVVEHVWTPLDIEANYRSACGSIYGVVSNRWKNMAFKAPKQSPAYSNLFFVGGSVNPGGGMPMVVLSGQHAARRIAQADQASS